jgi:hypothetical protein
LNFGGSLKGTENKKNKTLLLRLNLRGSLKETENRDFVELQETKKKLLIKHYVLKTLVFLKI